MNCVSYQAPFRVFCERVTWPLDIIILFDINKTTLEYYQAINYLNTDNEKEGLEILEKIFNSKEVDENIKTVSGLKIANELKDTDLNKSISIYKEIYNLKNNDLFLRNLSGLTALNLLINKNKTENYKEIEELINSMKNPNNPLILLVNEQEAMFEIQKGNVENGIKKLKELLNQNIDSYMIQRINNILKIYENI